MDKITPTVRNALIIGVVVLLGLLAVRQFSASPIPNQTQERGVKHP